MRRAECPALGQGEQHDADDHDQQEQSPLQKRVRGVREVDLDIRGRERADDERRQKRADPHCGGDADPLEDVEDEMHGAVPWASVTIDERAA